MGTINRNNIIGLSAKSKLILLQIVALLILFPLKSHALLNPAAVYCNALGYEYIVERSPEGVLSMCRLPDGGTVDGWKFLSGEVAQEYSYCVIRGHGIRTINGSSFCIFPDGREVEVTELMGLSFEETRCGDGSCGIPENYSTCPQDCPSGGWDGYCDGISDGECDPDCLKDEDSDFIDTDGDGVSDCNDHCPSDPLKTEPGACGCGIPDSDTDGDGTADCFDGCPNDSNKVAAGICGCGRLDTDTDGDGVADCIDNCPAVRNPDQADSNNNGIGDACEAATSKQICSILGNDPKPSILDQDIFKFSGNKGEKVTIRLEASPPDAGTGKRATLMLTDNIKKVRLLTLDRSELPNEITKKLPAKGEYLIIVAQPISATKDKRYAGGYCLTLQTASESYKTLAPHLGVE